MFDCMVEPAKAEGPDRATLVFLIADSAFNPLNSQLSHFRHQ